MQQQRKKEIDQRVKAAFDASKGRSGAERIFVDLEEGGQPLNIKTIRKSLKRQHLVPKAAKLFKVTELYSIDFLVAIYFKLCDDFLFLLSFFLFMMS